MVAVEQDFLGGEIDDDYAADDRVQYVVARPGDVLYMLLSDGQTTAIGSALVSTGTTAGELTVETTLDATLIAGAVVGWALEVVAASGSNARVRVRMA
jgi:hypothetical protein